ncbi:MAG: metallophosphoesterase family protein [Alphaproteobacteria bacterium]
MLKLIRKRWARARPAPFPAPTHAEGVIYAVGDVHGRHDLLARLLDRIFEDAAAYETTPKIVFLGDYIDRGEHAREAIDMLIELAQRPDAETVFLMGNHEQMLLRFLRDPSSGSSWLRYGGLQTLMSYGVGGIGSLHAESEAVRLGGALAEALGPHLGFIEKLRVSYRSGNLLFTHAGADPALPADEQEIATLLWGCEGFRTTDRDDGVWVVHGHFVVEGPTAERGRIAIDTGAYFSGRLTAARIAGGEVVFLEG